MTEEEYYARIKAEYESSTDPALVEWARPYYYGTKKPNGKDKYMICPVSDRAARDIFELTGSNVRGFSHVFQADVIKHICNEHGNNGKSDHSVNDIAHIGRVAYVLNNYDAVVEGSRNSRGFKNKNNERAKTIVFVKRLNGQVFAAEAVTDSIKNKNLHITSMYLKQYKRNSAQKMGSVITDQNNDLRPNVRNEADPVTSILPQPQKNVNSLENNSPYEKITVGELAARRRQEKAAHRAEKNGEKSQSGSGSGGKKPRDRGSSGR